MSIESRSKQYGGIFGDWHIEKKLGTGSNGKSAVFSLYRDNGGWREYRALKVISLIEEQGQKETMALFRLNEYEAASRSQRMDAEQEVRLMDQIRGKTNIVDYLDHKFFEWRDESEFGTDLLIQMELLTDLRSEMKKGRIFTEREVVKIGRDICQALVICHGKNILHRDIKPENIFFNADGDYKLGDFGISRILSNTSSALASTGIGTAAYSAPEQFHGRYDRRVDIYSLGLVLYELFNQNHLPFAVSSYVTPDQVQKRLSGVPLPELRSCSAALERIIRKACAYDARERYASAEEMLQALSSLGQKTEMINHEATPKELYETQYAKAAAGGKERQDPLPLGDTAALWNPYGTQMARSDSVNPKGYDTALAEGVRTTYSKPGMEHPEIKTRSRKPTVALAAAAVVLVAVCALFFLLGKQHDHTWLDATCTAPRTCESCDETEGVELGHTWSDPTCLTPGACLVCGEPGSAALGHRWTDATYDAPAECAACHVTEGVSLTEQTLAEVEKHVDAGQYRYAIQKLDKAWEESGDQTFFDMAADYRMDFGSYASTVIAAGKYNSAIRYSNGKVDMVGDGSFGELWADNWSDIAAIGMGDVHTVGLRKDGRVVMISTYDSGLLAHNSYMNWRNVVAISVGDMHTVGLLEDGTVVSDGYQCMRACYTEVLMAKAGRNRIVAIAAGFHQTLALLDNGTVVADGAERTMTALDVEDWTDIAAIAAGSQFSAGLRTDGTVVVTEVSWNVSDWKDIVALAAGDYFLLGLRADGTVVSVGSVNEPDVSEWRDIVCIAAGHDHAVAVDSQGYVHNAGSNNNNQYFKNGTNIYELP